MHIKTAYNCCCRGNYRNDYVDVVNGDENDYCALKKFKICLKIWSQIKKLVLINKKTKEIIV